MACFEDTCLKLLSRLRALSGGTEPEAQAKPVTMKRFKLAEFRYSKEDMLALFDDNFKMPKELEEFGDAIMQKTQIQPLSFIPLSKDEEVCCAYCLPQHSSSLS